jgi:hypothetical protein
LEVVALVLVRTDGGHTRIVKVEKEGNSLHVEILKVFLHISLGPSNSFSVRESILCSLFQRSYRGRANS